MARRPVSQKEMNRNLEKIVRDMEQRKNIPESQRMFKKKNETEEVRKAVKNAARNIGRAALKGAATVIGGPKKKKPSPPIRGGAAVLGYYRRGRNDA